MSDLSTMSSRDKHKVASAQVAPSPQEILELGELRGNIIKVIDEIEKRVSKQLSVSMSKIRKHYKDIVHDSRIVDLL